MNATKAKPASLVLGSSDGSVPGLEEVKEELLVWWDGFSPLSLGELRKAYELENTLDDVGIDDMEAQSFVNKYNSIIARAPGRGPLVRPSEAKRWVDKAMEDIVAEVHKRAQP